MKEYIELFTSFFKVGIMTFGGGMAMLPMLQAEIVDKKGWATEDELLNYYAVGQCTPGIIAVNTATFVGYKQKKTLGAACTTLGVVFPSLLIIMMVAAFLGNVSEYPIVQNALWGIRVAACALILSSIIKLFKSGVKNLFGMIMFLMAILVTGVFGITSVVMVIVAIVAGNLYRMILDRKGGKS
ncbi:MAG: chromate transporter [Lachnospiraceae bacterium]|jgi:chromate transporter|nr:chromate transporter [Lachnospiraceae bacterium]